MESADKTHVSSVLWDIGKSPLGSDGDKSLLQLLGSKLVNGEGRVLGGLEGDEVGQQTSDVGRGHRGTRDGVHRILATDPSGEDVETRGKDVVALAIVGEVSTLIRESRSTNGDGLLGSGRGEVARVSVVVASGDSKVDASINGRVDSQVESHRLASTQTHVGSAALEALGLALLGSLDLLGVSLSGPLDALDDIGHGSGAVGLEHLDGVDVGLLGNTVLLTSDSARAVGAMSVAINIFIANWDSLSPGSTALEVDVVDVGTGVNDVDINALTAISSVQVLVEGAEAKAVPVRDTSQTPRGVLLDAWVLHGVDL